MRKNRDTAPTIRGQLTRIVLIPSLCFLTLWLVVAAAGTVGAIRMMGAVSQAREGTQAFSEAVEEVRSERRMSMVRLGRAERGVSSEDAGSELDQQREAADAAMADAVALAEQLRGIPDEEVQRSAIALLDGPETLEEVRAGVDGGDVGREEALMRYGEVLDALTGAVTALVHATDAGQNLTDAVLTGELMGASSAYATADALLAGTIARGEMSYAETAHFTYLTASYRDTLESADAVMHPSVDRHYDEMVSDPSWARAEGLSRQVVTRPPVTEPADPEEEGAVPLLNTDIDVGAREWEASSVQGVLALEELSRAQADRTVDLAWSAALVRVSLGVAAAVLTLVCGVAAIMVVSRSSRRLTGRLARLRGQILERDQNLPEILDRAQKGEKVDVQEELPALDERGRDEIGQVAEAFDAAQLSAVESAVRQAEIRRGANRAFLGVAFRNQALVQRQLSLLGEIEHHEQDPGALRRLFHLDHLVTRARRYADNLIILGGGQSVRRCRQPRQLVDVLRAAIAETEDFARVRLTSAPRVLMRGQAIADVVHLLAELVENATQFSPAGTCVDVGCGQASGGLVVEVEDRGLGMSEHGYAEAERTLTRPPEFDVMALPDDPRLGLFVVARLAERHGVRVRLRPSSYGGTRATVLIPESLLEPAGPAAGDTVGSGQTGPQPLVPPVAHSGPQPMVPLPGQTGPQASIPPHGHTGPLGPLPLPGTGEPTSPAGARIRRPRPPQPPPKGSAPRSSASRWPGGRSRS